ncbi:MAG: hypothetical protein ABEI31_02540 [Halodesulfurarchaeum sp.]
MTALGQSRDRGGRFDRGVAIGAAFLIGMALGSVHWLGLLVGGVATGLIASTPRRAILMGFAYGLAVWGLSMGVVLVGNGAWNPGAMQLYGLSLGMAIVFGVVGASARTLRPLAVALLRGRRP